MREQVTTSSLGMLLINASSNSFYSQLCNRHLHLAPKEFHYKQQKPLILIKQSLPILSSALTTDLLCFCGFTFLKYIVSFVLCEFHLKKFNKIKHII